MADLLHKRCDAMWSLISTTLTRYLKKRYLCANFIVFLSVRFLE